jgi:hypothetical protein
LIKEYEGLPNSEKSWWGDQISLSKVIGPTINSYCENVFDVYGTRLLLLDSENYNWTPFNFDVSLATLSNNLFINKDLQDWADVDLAEKYVVHFKGPRKHLQYQFWVQRNSGGSFYIDALKQSFLSLRSEISREGVGFFENGLRGVAEYHQFLDLAVLSVLNIFSVDDKLVERDALLKLIGAYGDSRSSVLAGVPLSTRKL